MPADDEDQLRLLLARDRAASAPLDMDSGTAAGAPDAALGAGTQSGTG